MLMHFGVRLFGRVDNLHDLPFYIATSFFHIAFLPIIPFDSYIVVATGPNRWLGLKIPFSTKSLVAAYIRGWLIPIPAIFGLVGFIVPLSPHSTFDPTLAAVSIAALIVAFLACLSYGSAFWRASPDRACEIRKALAGASPKEKTDLAPFLENETYPEYYVKLQGTALPGLRRFQVRGHATLILVPGRATLMPRSLAPSQGNLEILTNAGKAYCDEEQKVANLELPDGRFVVFTFFSPDLVQALKQAYGTKYERVNLPTLSFLSMLFDSMVFH